MFDQWGTEPSLRVERVRYAHGNLVVVVGELDLATVGALADSLADLPHTGDVLLDLGQVSFLGVVGLRLLLHCADQFRRRGQVFSICAMRPQHRRLLARLDLLDDLVSPDAHLPFP